MKYLQEYCKKYGPGLERKHLKTLRELLAVIGVEERRINDGYSYFPSGSGSMGRILKIVDWGRLFIEFNLLFDITVTETVREDIIWLDDEKRDVLHAGGVEFCYVGKEVDIAADLIKAALEEKFGEGYESLPKNKLPFSTEEIKRQEKMAILVPPGDKEGKVEALLRGFCRKYNVEPVPIHRLSDCLEPDTPKTILAYNFSEKQWQFFPPGFIPISLKELASRGNIESLKTFKDLQNEAQKIFSYRWQSEQNNNRGF